MGLFPPGWSLRLIGNPEWASPGDSVNALAAPVLAPVARGLIRRR